MRSRLATDSGFASFTLMALVLMALGTGCSGPFLLLPGGELEGKTVPTPTSWTFTDEISTIQLETRPADPYSVNIWAVAMGDQLYLHAGANRTTWVENIEEDNRVRVSIEGSIYELVAVRVVRDGEFGVFADAYEAKYRRRPRNENISKIYLYRMGAR